MKKVALSVITILAFLIYGIYQKTTGSKSESQIVPIPSPLGQTSQDTLGVHSYTYKDGVYTGNATDAFYGTIQVQVVISNNKITDINFLQYPNDRQQSMMINNYAIPILKQEVINNQSANVDIVSGATASCQAFIKSLNSALTNAL